MLSAFNVIVLRAFFANLPSEIIESARIDGAGELKTFGYIVLPLSKAVLSVIGLFYAVGYWNAFFSALLYLNDSKLWPLQLVLRTYVINDTQLGSAELGSERLPPQASIQMAILVVSIVPILLVYPFLQRHFAKGVLTGASSVILESPTRGMDRPPAWLPLVRECRQSGGTGVTGRSRSVARGLPRATSGFSLGHSGGSDRYRRGVWGHTHWSR